MNFSSLCKLKEAFSVCGCSRLLVKKMAANDNSKNQIYLGGDFSALNLLPFKNVIHDQSQQGGSIRERLKTTIDFGWINGAGVNYNLVNLILYPKYPEVRLSGLLKHKTASKEVASLINSREEGRLLFLGVNSVGKVLAHCTGKDENVTKEFWNENDSSPFAQRGVFLSVNIKTSIQDPKEIIVSALKPIVEMGWVKSQRLDKYGNLTDCLASNCGGYTLESLLGIIPNGISAPDYEGWEVKQYGVTSFKSRASKAITLMTPEPDGGLYREQGVKQFIKKYGYPDRKVPNDRFNFGGVHKVNHVTAKTNMSLNLNGYDLSSSNKWEAGGAIELLDFDRNVAASWSFAGLLKHWKRKHAQAVYIKSMLRTEDGREYIYSPRVELGIGTDFSKFLEATAKNSIYYDPGIKITGYESGVLKVKRRSQFRVKSKMLSSLYRNFEEVEIV